jgi:mRNA-degrading endonuclease toxin of MazEF toxin-antitoxin module
MACPELPEIPTQIKIEHTAKGCVHWFDFEDSDPSIKSQKARPYIIISRDNPKSDRAIICPISDISHYYESGTNKLKYPYHAPLYRKYYPFLEKSSAVLLDQVYTIAKNELCEEWYIGKVEDFTDIDLALVYNYDMFESISQAYIDLINQLPNSHMSQFTRQ